MEVTANTTQCSTELYLVLQEKEALLQKVEKLTPKENESLDTLTDKLLEIHLIWKKTMPALCRKEQELHRRTITKLPENEDIDQIENTSKVELSQIELVKMKEKVAEVSNEIFTLFKRLETQIKNDAEGLQVKVAGYDLLKTVDPNRSKELENEILEGQAKLNQYGGLFQKVVTHMQSHF